MRWQTYYLDTIEATVVNALRGELRHPEIITEFVRTYHEERKRLASHSARRHAAAHRRLGEISRETARVVDNIAKGRGDPSRSDGGPSSCALSGRRSSRSLVLSIPSRWF
jgi:site-specific DNA recombinase